MRYANAIWNYTAPEVALSELVQEFIEFGYDGISFSSSQLPDVSEREAEEITGLMRDHGLVATLHCSVEVQFADVEWFRNLLGGLLHVISLDPVTRWEPRGGFYDTARMVPFVRDALRLGEETGLQVAIEDFPLDDCALDFYRTDLQPLLDCPRYGLLIDVGHLNMRLHGGGYFDGMTVADYIERLPLPVVEVHLHDNNGERDEHGHFGFGNVDFGGIAAGLKSVGFDGISTIEIAPTFHGSTPFESKPHAIESLKHWREIWEG